MQIEFYRWKAGSLLLLLSFFFLTTLSLVVKINAKSKAYAESNISRLHYTWSSKVEFTPKGQRSGPNQREDDTSLQFFTWSGLCFQQLNSNGPEIVKKKTFDPKCHLVIGHTVQWSLQPIACCKLRSGSFHFVRLMRPACPCRAGERCSGEADASTGIGLEHFYTWHWGFLKPHSSDGKRESFCEFRLRVFLRFLWIIESVILSWCSVSTHSRS